jgi:hypothetical protein
MAQIRLSTVSTTVAINDLGGVVFQHPTTNFILFDTNSFLNNPFSLTDIQNSKDLQNAIQLGLILITGDNGIIFNDIFDAVKYIFGISSSLPLPFSQGNQYLLYEDFDKGVAPQGWFVSTLMAGFSVSFTSDNEINSMGLVNLLGNVNQFQGRAGILFSNNYNYLLKLNDAKYTVIFFKIKPFNNINTCFMQIGLSNTIVVNPLLNSFNNTISLRYDPQNRAGGNPTLISNWFLYTKKLGFGENAVDTGISYSPSDWLNCYIIYDNYDNINPKLRLYINNNLVATISDMTNVPNNLLNNGMKPHAIIGNGNITSASNQYGLMIDKISLYKLYE